MPRLGRALYLVLGVILLPATGKAELQLGELIEEALASNPSLESLRHGFKAEEAAVPPAGALEDPRLSVGLSNVPLSELDFGSTPMSGKELSLSQRLPYWGKRRGREQVAVERVAAAQARYRDREGAIVNAVKQAYFTLVFANRAIEITQRNEDLLRDFIRVTQSKYAVGRGSQQDVLRAQLSLSKIKMRLISLRMQRQKAEAELNAVRNLPPQAEVEATGKIDGRHDHHATYDPEKLQQLALENRPLLREIRARAAGWEASAQLAALDSRPDFDVSVRYRQRDLAAGDPVAGSDFVSVEVAVNLPIHGARVQDQKRLEAFERSRGAQAELEEAKQQVFLDIQKLCVDIVAHLEEDELLRTAIIPQAQQSLSAAVAGYQVDIVDFLALLDSQSALFDLEVDSLHHVTEYEKSRAALEAVVGKRLY